MLSFDGWAVGIAYLIKIVYDSFSFFIMVYNGKKKQINLLYFPALNMISFTFAYLIFVFDFFHIILTGQNMQFTDLTLLYFISFLFVGMLSGGTLALILAFPEKKKVLLIGTYAYMLMVYCFSFFLDNFGFSLTEPSPSGITPVKIYLSFNSIMFYLIIPFSIIALIFGFVFLIKSLKIKGNLRRKFQMLASVYILSCFWLLFTFLPDNSGLFFAILFVGLTFFVNSSYYYGLTPIKDKKPKKVKTPSKAELKFVSYLTDKSQPDDYRNLSSSNLKQDVLIFMSYATKDADLFKVKEIAEKLTKSPDIQDVLYWQEDMEDNIIEYMNDNLGKCHVFILFCSKNSLESVPVKKEWTAADAMGTPIIPVFFNPEYIPPLLRSRLGIEYDFYDLDRNVMELHSLILKKCGGVLE